MQTSYLTRYVPNTEEKLKDNGFFLTFEEASLDARRRTDRDTDGDSWGVFTLTHVTAPAEPNSTIALLS